MSTETEVQESFRVSDDSSASWAMRKLRELRLKMRENDTIAHAELERITGWLHHENSKLAEKAQFFEEHLIDYARRQRQDQERKAISLPYGVVRSRLNPETVIVSDAFLEWATKEADDLLTYSPPKPNKTEIKKALEAGRIVEGVMVVPGSIAFSIEVAK